MLNASCPWKAILGPKAIGRKINRLVHQDQRTLGCGAHGAEGRTRTGDLLITNQLLYQLSYSSVLCACAERSEVHAHASMVSYGWESFSERRTESDARSLLYQRLFVAMGFAVDYYSNSRRNCQRLFGSFFCENKKTRQAEACRVFFVFWR